MRSSCLSSLSLLATALLTACGGGGSSPEPVTPIAITNPFTATCPDGTQRTSAQSLSAALALCPTPQPAATASSVGWGIPIVQSLASAATYSGEEAAAYNFLNAARSQCGFGLLAQSDKLDQAARSHVNWMLTNNISSHWEDPSYPKGYTGVWPSDRAQAAGYGNWLSVVEDFAQAYAGRLDGQGVIQFRGLMAAPYHLTSLLSESTEVGLSIQRNASDGLLFALAKLGYAANSPQLQKATDVLTFPCQGVTNAVARLGIQERPNPNRDFTVRPIGQPIVVRSRLGQPLAVTSATLQPAGGGAPIALVQINSANDPNKMLRTHELFLMPDVPLAANTSYAVTVSGTNSGVAFSLNFTFTTGAN